jgi:hypothetical protein
VRSRTLWTVLLLSILLLPSGSLLGADVPLQDWSAPPSYKPAGERSAMAIFYPFKAVQPCRVYDSRNFTILSADTARVIPMDGLCSLPAGARAYSVHITAFGSAASTSYGFITAYPAGTTRPVISTMNFLGGSQTSTAAIVPAGSGSDITIYTTTTTHFVVDVNGFYSDDLGGSDYFSVEGSYSLGLAWANNRSTTEGASSFRGYSSGAGKVFGVSGEITSAALAGAAGVRAYAPNTTRATYGLFARSDSAADASGAINATAAAGTWAPKLDATTWGVRGAAGRAGWAVGVYGEGHDEGVVGLGIDSADGGWRTRGCLGCPGTNGVYSYNNLGAAGTKTFIEPHPTQAGKVIKFAALEGNEAGTYFRGRARIIGGEGVVVVPDEFRMVTADESITVQVTPIGEPMPIAVTYVGTDRVEFTARTDVEFFYQVNGVRKAFPQWEAIQEDDGFFFTPSHPAARLEQVYPEEARKRLVENGTFNPDGSVNLGTAERMGWAQAWREREAARALEAQSE